MIKVLNSSLVRLGTLKQVNNASRLEEINGENTLDFDADLDDVLKSVIDENAIFEVDNNYFDIAKFKKDVNEDDSVTIEVESEHVSYRLNNEEYNVDFFTEQGTPTYILGKILEGTGFTVGTVSFTDVVTYSAQEAKSRRQLLMEFVAYLKGEIDFNKFEINIYQFRGSQAQRPLIKGKNVTVISKVVNKREKDADGNVLVSYKCTPIYLPGDVYTLGDSVRLIQQDLGVNESLRLVSITTNPYNLSQVTFQLANYVNGLEDRLYRIETSTVVKDRVYNGTRIGPEFGFENIRTDKLARSYFRADEMKFQTGDGSGEVWRDRLYYDFDEENDEVTLFFNGKMTVEALEAIKAEIDIVVSNTIIVNNLYAEYGRVANLSVSELDTSWKMITNYLLKNIDVEESLKDVNYQRIYEDATETWTAEVIDNNNPTNVAATVVSSSAINITWSNATSGNTTQYTNKEGQKLYWVDATLLKSGMTTNVTDYPVMTYTYKKLLKKVESMELVNGVYTVRTWYGAGLGVDNRGRAYNLKDTNGWIQGYVRNNNIPIEIELGEDGIIQRGNTGSNGLRNIAIGTAAPANPQNGDLWIDTDA